MFKPFGSKPNANYQPMDYGRAEPGVDSSFRRQQQVNMPAAVFNRSPYRERYNRPNVGNTPGRKLIQNSKPNLGTDSSKRISISPLRHQRQISQIGGDTFTKERSIMDHSSSSSKILSQNSLILGRGYTGCSNHSNKPARFIIQIEDEELPYCEKCAILLASQGFRVTKLEESYTSPLHQEPQYDLDNNNPRKQEINLFLEDLTSVMQALYQKKEDIYAVVKKSDTFYEGQFTMIDSYYNKIVELLHSHRQAVEKALRYEKQKSEKEAQDSLSILTEAISHSNNMKEDILTSLDLIKEADEKSFRPVMEAYKKDTKKFRHTTNKISIPAVACKKLVLNDLNEVRESIIGSIHVEFRNEGLEMGRKSPQPEISNIESVASISSVNFSFYAKMAAELDRDYCSGVMEPDDVNPLVESEEYSRDKFKSSMKNSSKGLFAADFHE